MSPPLNTNNKWFMDAAYDDRDENDESLMHVSLSSCGLVILSYKKRDGCASFEFYHKFTILNPITGDKVKIKIANKDDIRGRIFGAFFHPVQKEMCVLLGLVPTEPLWPKPLASDGLLTCILDRHFVVEEFKLLNLGRPWTEPRWTSINNESARRILTRHLQPRCFQKRGQGGPVISGDYMYWMVEDFTLYDCPRPNPCQEAIIAFHTTSREFRLLPHPAPLPCCNFSLALLQLV